tara:strand:+ start:44 stop:967 length:924 start_codon:yes stop_codon:yes gene_type:complete
MIKSPIIFITYKRPTETKKILKLILKQKFSKIYIFQDGLNHKLSEVEKKKFIQTREIIQKIKSKKIKVILFKKNIGLKYVAKKILGTVFKLEKKAIILEDDTVPEKSFFSYCDNLLEKYKENKKIAHISGCNLHYGTTKKKLTQKSYFYSKFPHVWGWATWSDRWLKYYDPDIKNWPKDKSEFLNNCNLKPGEKRYFKFYLDKIYYKNGPGWDQQWIFSNILNNLKTIVPQKNLIKNIGYNSNPTGKSAKKFRDLHTQNIRLPLVHDHKHRYNKTYDEFLYKSFYKRDLIFLRVIKRIKLLIKYLKF